MNLSEALIEHDEVQATSPNGIWRIEVHRHTYISDTVYSWYAYLANSIKESDEDYGVDWDSLVEVVARYECGADAEIWEASA